MAMVNVIPEIWSGTIIPLLRKRNVAVGISNTTIASSLQTNGDKFHIPLAGDATTFAYNEASTTITYEDPTDTEAVLVIDQDQVAATKISDEEVKQANQNWQTERASRMVFKLSRDIDIEVLGRYTEAGIVSQESSSPWKLGATGAKFPELIASLMEELDSIGAEDEGRYFVMPSIAIQAYRLHVGAKATPLGDSVTVNGMVGHFNGMDLIRSNNLTTVSTTTHGICGIRGDSIATAIQIDPSDVEALRLEGKYATGIRARAKWGSKVYRPANFIDVELDTDLLS